jgi:hypothetical protein
MWIDIASCGVLPLQAELKLRTRRDILAVTRILSHLT